MGKKIRLPVVADIQAGEYLLRDRRNMGPSRKRTAGESYEKYLTPRLQEVRPVAKICSRQRRANDRHLERIINSGMSIRAYQEKYGFEPLDAEEMRPDLGVLELGVYTQSSRIPPKFIGLFTLYNVCIESGTPEKIEITAFPCPAFDTTEKAHQRQGQFLETILEEDLVLSSGERIGQVVDLIAWRFPQRPEQAWITDDGDPYPPISRLMRRGHLVRFRDIPDGQRYPFTARRKGTSYTAGTVGRD